MKEKNNTNNFSEYVMVKAKALPDVFTKVLKAKEALEQGVANTVQEAIEIADLSRSAFYKYRDAVYPIAESRGKTITLSFCLSDSPGILSNILNIIADCGSNILTINQTIPINCIAYVTITVQTNNMDSSLSALLEKLKKIKGVCSIKILSGE